jgi:DNA-binding MarR family transcriptional regulator
MNERSRPAQGLWQELARLARLLGRVGPDEVCCDGLTQRQTAVLRTLVEREGAPLRDLAQASGITASAMTRNIERLEGRGLVERVRGAQSDKREATVRITAKGRCLRQQLDRLMLARAESLWLAMPASKRRSAVQALRVLNDAFAKAGCCPLNQPVAQVTAPKMIHETNRFSYE